MTPGNDTRLYEALELFPAWEVLVGRVSTADPRTADPRSVYGSALAAPYDRLVALLYGHGHGESLEDAEQSLLCLLALAAEGKRPRYLAEVLGVAT